MLLGHRDRGPIPSSTGKHPPDPLAAPLRFRPCPAERRPSAVDQELAQGAIPALPDPQQAGLPSRGVWSGDEPSPRGKLPAIRQALYIAYRGDERRRREGTNAGNRQQALALRMRGGHRLKFLIVIDYFGFTMLQFFPELAKQFLA